MSSRRGRVMVGAGVAAALLLAWGHRDTPRAQAPAARRIVAKALNVPAIDRGLDRSESRGPDSTDSRLRRALTREGAARTSYVPGRVLVKFKEGVAASARLRAASAVSRSAAIGERLPYANFDLVTIDPADNAEEVARTFAARSDVDYAQALYRFRPYLVPNDTFYRQGLQWNFPQIDLERAWDIQPEAGSTITVAVLDSGVAYRSTVVRFFGSSIRFDGVTYPALGQVDVPFAVAPDLATAATANTRFVRPRDFIWNDEDPLDLDGHGTHVAGTVGQLTNNNQGVAGVAFNVRIMPVKVLDGFWDYAFGAPFEATDDVVARGVRYAADNGAQVINMSLGRTGPPSPVMQDAVQYAVNRGSFVVISGGNEFEEGNPVEVLAEIASRIDGAVSVAATDRGRNRAFYSSTGSYIEVAAPGGSFRGFGAEGGVLQQTIDLDLSETFLEPLPNYRAPRFDVMAYFYFTGTSMAAPHVAGLGAMLHQQGITSPQAIEAAIKRFADDRGAAGRDNSFGFGEINARNTLRGLGLAR